ncbi:MAG: LptF/LptG family permease [Holophagales bacterium]|nr:LptF/LptG family permease [Holophagales bacterium]MBK9967793.1 LptF/LptG family permease [Holophagales bacterium]
MKLTHRYALREILAPTVVAFAIYTGFMLIRGLVQFSDLLLQSSNPLWDTGRVLAFSIPHVIVLTLPIAFLLGILVGVGRLSQDSELVALKAAGVDLFTLYKPISVLAVLFTLTTALVMTAVVPRTNRILYGMKLELSTFAIAQRIQPGVFSPEFAGRRIYVERASPDRRTLEGLILADNSNPAEGERLTLAKRGSLELEEKEGRLWLRLEEAVTHHTAADARGYDRASYRTQRVLLDDTNPRERFAKTRPDKQLREMTFNELLQRAKTTRDDELARLSWVEIHKKFSFPAACLVFGLIGLPLGVVNRRGGRAAGFTVSTAIVLGYYILYASGEARAVEGSMSPVLAMWLPNLLLVVLGAFAIGRVRRDRTLFDSPVLDRAAVLIGRSLPRRFRNRALVTASSPDRAFAEGAVEPTVTRAWLVDRYVATRFLQLFALVLSSIMGIYLLIEYLEISNDIARVRPPVAAVLGYFEAKLAPILVDVVPLAFAAAALIAVAGLVRSSETTALLAHGISLLRTTASILVLAILAGGALVAFSETIVPRSAAEAERLRNVLLGKPPAATSDGWRSFLRGDSGRFFSAETWDTNSSSVTGVTIFQLDPASFSLERKSYGARGRIVPGKGIALIDGWTRTFGKDGGSLFLKQAGTSFVEAPEAARTFLAGRADPRQMNSLELSRFVRLRRKAGADVSGMRTGLYQKSAVSLAPLLLTLVGLPFAFRLGKKGAVAGIGIALLLGLAYLILSAVLIKGGEAGSLPPLLAAWGANLFFTLGAGWGLLGIRT